MSPSLLFCAEEFRAGINVLSKRFKYFSVMRITDPQVLKNYYGISNYSSHFLVGIDVDSSECHYLIPLANSFSEIDLSRKSLQSNSTVANDYLDNKAFELKPIKTFLKKKLLTTDILKITDEHDFIIMRDTSIENTEFKFSVGSFYTISKFSVNGPVRPQFITESKDQTTTFTITKPEFNRLVATAIPSNGKGKLQRGASLREVGFTFYPEMVELISSDSHRIHRTRINSLNYNPGDKSEFSLGINFDLLKFLFAAIKDKDNSALIDFKFNYDHSDAKVIEDGFDEVMPIHNVVISYKEHRLVIPIKKSPHFRWVELVDKYNHEESYVTIKFDRKDFLDKLTEINDTMNFKRNGNEYNPIRFNYEKVGDDINLTLSSENVDVGRISYSMPCSVTSNELFDKEFKERNNKVLVAYNSYYLIDRVKGADPQNDFITMRMHTTERSVGRQVLVCSFEEDANWGDYVVMPVQIRD